MPGGRTLTAVGVSLLALAKACGSPSAPPTVDEDLPPGEIAAVGDERILEERVIAVARAQGLSARAALDRLLRDALLARGARERYGESWARGIEAEVAARALLLDAQAAAAARPPTPEEVAAAVERRFHELDRPPAVRTVHAVARVRTPADEATAARVARRLDEATRDAAGEPDFVVKARAVPTEGLEVRVESLPAVVEDGRTLPDPGRGARASGMLDTGFARAAHQLARPGDQTLVRTGFGWHVVRLVERLPEVRLPEPERLRRVLPDIHRARAREAEDALLASLRARLPVEESPGVLALLREVTVAP